VSISLADPTHSTQIRGDHDRLSQVMANLLSNATKFSPEGGSVEVSITSNGSFVRVAVADYGPGIPQESRDTIFDRFTQAHQTDSSRIGGTGLGLSICKSIIEHHAGTIGFETEDGSGSTFYFELPNRKDQSVRSG
ncbi:MAG: ATP-binding protein, partial [Alphaproteobacteria bacterium]|nr:ATP-binding protein [Alphaproteobacteria bacterium]